jgi:hypothetical protein
MSHTYDTTTFAIVPPASSSEGLPATPSSTYAYERSQVPGEPLVYTWGATRSGWAIYQTGIILKRLDLPALAFLTVDGAEHPLATEGGQHGYTIIDTARQPEVIAQFHAFFAQLKADPMLAEDDFYGTYDDDEIAPALARDYVSSRPSLDSEVWGEDGQSADYLFTFLRSILAVIENARAEGLWAVHELSF